MLLSCSIGNWLSFRDKVTFSMVASKERQHASRLPRIKKYQTKILPIATIYGGNASGKTNFFKAINFAKFFVTAILAPDSRIPVTPYLLDEEYRSKPSVFKFEILAEETVYEYCFSVTQEKVVEEKLTAISSSSEKILFSRTADEIKLEPSLLKNTDLQAVARGTRDNTLFLTNTVSQKITKFLPVYNWFLNNLVLIGPSSRYQSAQMFFDEQHRPSRAFSSMLSKLDTGISRFGGVKVPLESIPQHMLLGIDLQGIKEGTKITTCIEDARFIISRINGELVAKKLVTYHKSSKNQDVRFDVWQESDGSLRLLNLIPAFLTMSEHNSNHVFFIDEIDRSLHTLLSRALVEFYIGKCSEGSRNQLLITTHDVLLMDQSILRRDEMWVTERDMDGASSLIPFSDYKDVRYDKDIRKSYLQGRLGGIPRLLLDGVITASSISCEEEHGQE